MATPGEGSYGVTMRTLICTLTFAALLTPALVAQETRVLFLGNSYTNRNDLPGLVEALSASLGRTVTTDRNTPGGNTLGAPQSGGQPHRSNTVSLAKIATGGWDFVVLQEQSTLPTIPFARDQYMLPGAASLAVDIQAANAGAEILLYQTWGRRDGGQFCAGSQCSSNFADFDAMQDRLSISYRQCRDHIASSPLPVGIANVGEAWRRARHLNPNLNLHAGDGSHPNVAGSYLAACVFYTQLFGESPEGAAFDAGLGAPLSSFLQEVAAAVGLCGAATPVCPPLANSVSSTGAPMTHSGSTSLSAGDLALEVTELPANSFALFLMGPEGAATPVGDGLLCIGAGIARIAPAVQSGPSGIARLDFDTTLPALRCYAPLVGDSVVFQLWYRDVGPMGPGSNLSGGLSVSFCP